MEKLIIDNLWPNNTLRFALQGEAYEEVAISQTFKIKVPPAAHLISKSDVQVKVGPPIDQYGGAGEQFNFSKFSRQPYNKSGYYVLRILLRDPKSPKNLKVGDKARIQTDSALLANLVGDNKFYTILYSAETITNKTWRVDLEVPIQYLPTVSSGNVNVNTSFVREVKPRKTLAQFTVSVEKDRVFDNLINVKKPATGQPVLAVKDIPIYAFVNFNKENSNKLPKLLMFKGANNILEINEKRPPEYDEDMSKAYLAGPSFTQKLYIDEKRNFLFYVAIARYTRRNNKWYGDWLQKNKDGKAIWKKARLIGD
jgi:hypothetical protein